MKCRNTFCLSWPTWYSYNSFNTFGCVETKNSSTSISNNGKSKAVHPLCKNVY